MEHWNPTHYLKEGRDKGYNEQYLDRLMTVGRAIRSNNLPVIFSLSHLANLSRTRYSDLHSYVSRGQTRAGHYKNFTISKRSGGKRWISIPVPPLMAVQRWISQNILNSVTPHKAAYAYVLNRRTRDHAEKHCAAEWILKVDIKDFFSNISERQVFRVFESLGYPKLLSFEMARLCTRETPRRKGTRWANQVQYDTTTTPYPSRTVGSLPQGAPTSPALSNLVCVAMDIQLEALAQKSNATYSRYADDLCFSFADSSRAAILEIKRGISKVLWNNGFRENPKKTRIIPPGARKVITGLLVNENTPLVPREIRDRIKMHLYYCKKFNIPDHCRTRGFRSVVGFRNHLQGLIQYVSSINPPQAQKFLLQFAELPWIEFDI